MFLVFSETHGPFALPFRTGVQQTIGGHCVGDRNIRLQICRRWLHQLLYYELN